MFDLGGIFDPGKWVNNIIDQMLPGQLGDIIGDFAGAYVDFQSGNIFGAADLFKDAFTKLAQMFNMPQTLQDFVSDYGSILPEPGYTPPFGNTLDPQGHLSVDGNKIVTPGGYTIEAVGNNTWKITSPTGKVTTISGDPHVHEKDGGVWDWDNKTMTFNLPDGTKVTAHATGPNGVTTDFDVYYGNEHVQATGINTGHPHVSTVRYDAAVHDMLHDDGHNVYLGGDGDDWFTMVNGQLREITGGGGHGELKFGGGFWIDGALRTAAQVAGLPHDAVPEWNDIQGIRDFVNQILQQNGGKIPKLPENNLENKIKNAFLEWLMDTLQGSEGEDYGEDKKVKGGKAGILSGKGSFLDRVMDKLFQIMEAKAQKVDTLINEYEQAVKKDPESSQNTAKMFKLQKAMNELNQMMQTLTNIMKTIHDARMSVARNLKG